MKREELLDRLIADGLVGPWSWSDMLSHAAVIVAYGALRSGREREVVVDEILALLRGQAMEILREEKDASTSGASVG